VIKKILFDYWKVHASGNEWRAIEQGFNLIRRTDRGMSVGVDYTGRVISEADWFRSADKVLIAELPTEGATTAYSKIGDSFA
jgi:apolipoprotein N-acyltransferase